MSPGRTPERGGVHGRTRTCDPRILTTSAFTAASAFVVWTVPSPWAEAFRCCPSSLYTFTGMLRSLARDWHAESSAKRSPNLSRSIVSFPKHNPQLYQESCALSELSYVDFLLFRRRVVTDTSTKINQTEPVMIPVIEVPMRAGIPSQSVSFLPLKSLYPAELRDR